MFNQNPANEDNGISMPQLNNQSSGVKKSFRPDSSATILTATQSIGPEQLEESARLYAASFRGPPWFENWTETQATQEIQAQLSAGAWMILATDSNQAILGLALTIPLRMSPRGNDFSGLPLSNECWYFSDFCVAAEAQNLGLGKRLLQAAAELSASFGADSMLTRTKLDNFAARRAFERLQFEIVANLVSETGGCSSERVVYLKEFIGAAAS